MKEHLGTRDIYNRATKTFEPSDIFRGLDQKNLTDYETLWKPLLRARRAEFSSAASAAAANTQDAHWNWVEKAVAAEHSMAYETFAIEATGTTQGLMLVNLTKQARLESQRGLELVYIELVASAPWNRPRFVDNPKYKGIGRHLVATAVSLSVELGFKGRIGLHSLPQSESWYRDEAKFATDGYDESKSMHYFELTEELAQAFLGEN